MNHTNRHIAPRVSFIGRRIRRAALPHRFFMVGLIVALAAWAMGENAHDFGSVVRGFNYSNTFIITNQYATDLRITQIRPMCPCVKVVSYDPVIPVGGASRVTLMLDSARLWIGMVKYGTMVHMSTNLVSLPASATGGTVTNPATPPSAPATSHQEIQQLEMRATLLDDVTIVPAVHECGTIAATGRVPPFHVEVYSRTSRDIPELSTAAMPPWLCAKALPSAEGNSGGVTSRWTILCACTGMPPVGPLDIQAPFLVVLKNYEGQALPTNAQYAIRIKGSVDPVFSLQPTLVVLTEISVSNGAEQTVTFSSPIGAPLYITGVKSSGPAVTVGTFNTNDPLSVSVVLRIKPVCVGMVDETVSFSIAHEAQREISVRVLGNGR